MIYFEFPAAERIRFWLRLERIFERFFDLEAGTTPAAHHAALQALFELLDVISRIDIRTDLLKKLLQQQTMLQSQNAQKFAKTLRNIDEVSEALFQFTKLGWQIRQNEWLMLLKQRFNVPGSVCPCDLPTYFVWQKRSVIKRRRDLNQWIKPFLPIYQAVCLLLGLLRESGTPQDCVAQAGVFQLTLTEQNIQLFRLCFAKNWDIAPEFFANKYMLSIRCMAMSTDQVRTQPMTQDISFILVCCQL